MPLSRSPSSTPIPRGRSRAAAPICFLLLAACAAAKPPADETPAASDVRPLPAVRDAEEAKPASTSPLEQGAPATVRALRSPKIEHTFEDAPPGLSGLSRDAAGDLWAIAEGGILVRVDHADLRCEGIPIRGLPAGVEIESLAALDARRIVIGTEVDAQRTTDAVLIAERHPIDPAYDVVDRIDLDYRLWNATPNPDEGIEGLCVVGDSILVGAESVHSRGGQRYAPLGHYDRRTERWTATSIRLTTSSGKLAGLSCRKAGDSIEFVAIERHFGVTRILRGRLGAPIAPAIEPAVVYDWPEFGQNLEGIVWNADGRIELVNDNFYRGRSDGFGSLYSAPLPPAGDAAPLHD